MNNFITIDPKHPHPCEKWLCQLIGVFYTNRYVEDPLRQLC